MSLAASDPRRCSPILPQIEALEPRLLLTTLMGGDIFEYVNANDEWVRIALEGDVIAEFISADVDADGNLLLGNMPGMIYTNSYTGANYGGFRGEGGYTQGQFTLGGPAGRLGSILISPVDMVNFPWDDDGNEDGNEDQDVQAIATQSLDAGAQTYGIHVGEIQITDPDGNTVDSNIIELIKLDDWNQGVQAETVAVLTTALGGEGENEVQTVTITNATGGVFTLSFQGDATGPLAFDAAAADVQTALEALAGINAGDVQVAMTTPSPTVRTYEITFTGNLGYQNVADLIINGAALTDDGTNLVTTSVAETTESEPFESDVDSILAADFHPISGLLYFVVLDQDDNQIIYTVDVTAATPADIANSVPVGGLATISLPTAVQGAEITSIVFDQAGANVTLYGITDSGHLLTIDPNTGTVLNALGVVFEEELVTDITGIEFIDDDPDLAETTVFAVGTGSSGSAYEIDIATGAASFLGTLNDEEYDTQEPIRGQSISSVAWHPMLRDPFTGEFGAMIGVDNEADELVFIDPRRRSPSSEIFAIYVVQASENASITMGIVPEFNPDGADEDRLMDPYGSDEGIRVNPVTGSTLVLSGTGGVGGVYIGMRTEFDAPMDHWPIIAGYLDMELGVRPMGIDDVPALYETDDMLLDLWAGIKGVASLLQYVNGSAMLRDRLLGYNLDNVTQVAVRRDGEIWVIDADGINEFGETVDASGNAIPDQLAQIDPVTGKAISALNITSGGAFIGGAGGGVMAAAFGNADLRVFDGNEALYAVITSFSSLPSASIGGDLGGDFDGEIVGLAKTAGSNLFAVRDNGGVYELWQITTDATGVTGFTQVGGPGTQIETAAGQAVTGINLLEADPLDRLLVVGTTAALAGQQAIFEVDRNTGVATELYALQTGSGAGATPIIDPVVAMAATRIAGAGGAPDMEQYYLVVNNGGTHELLRLETIGGSMIPIYSYGALMEDTDGDGVGDAPVIIEEMDFGGGGLVAIDRGLGAGTGRLLNIVLVAAVPPAPPDPAQPPRAYALEASPSSSIAATMMGFTASSAGQFYTINGLGAATNDELWTSVGAQTQLGEVNLNTGEFTGQVDIAVAGVTAMAFSPGQGSVAGVQGLWVVGFNGELWEVNAETGAAIGGAIHVTDTTGLDVFLSAIDFDANGNLFGHDQRTGRLVDINPATGEAGANVATSAGSLRPTLGGLSYDAANDRFLTVDNATGREFLQEYQEDTGRFASREAAMTPEGAILSVESSVLMELVGYQSDSAVGQKINRIMVGGIVTGMVDWAGSIDTFYGGWIVTGGGNWTSDGLNYIRVTGQSLYDAVIPDNFVVTGDLRNLISSNSIGTHSEDADDTNPRYIAGFDLQVGGKLGQLWTLERFIGEVDVENQQDISGGLDSSIFHHEIEMQSWESISENPEGVHFEWFEFHRDDGAFYNDTYDTAEHLGTSRNAIFGEGDRIIVSGLLQGVATDADDDLDFYALSLLAGQTIKVRLGDENGDPFPAATLNLGIFDSDGRCVATDMSDVDPEATAGQEFHFTADRAGIYAFAVGVAPFVDQTFIPGEIPYLLYIDDAGDLAVGAVRAETEIYNYDYSLMFDVARGDFGTITARERFRSYAEHDAEMWDVYVADGSLRAVVAGEIGWTRDVENDVAINTAYGVTIEVSGSIGLFRTLLADGAMDLYDVILGGDMQWIDCAGNLQIWALTADGGLGTLRTLLWSWDELDEPAGRITVNADNIGSDGFIDLIDVAGDLGSMERGGPAFITGLGGNVRFMRVGGSVYGDRYFGANYDTRTQLDPGESVTLTDDSGGLITLRPVNDLLDLTTGLPPVGEEAWLTYRSYGIRGSGGVVIIDVTSTGSLAVHSESGGNNSPVEIGQIIVGGQGRDLVNINAPDDGDEIVVPDDAVYELEPYTGAELTVTINGDTPVDVFEIIGGNFDEAEIQNNRLVAFTGEGGNFTEIINSTGGDILGMIAESVGTIVCAGNLGVTSNHTGQQLLPLVMGILYDDGTTGTFAARVDEARVLADSYPYVGQTSGIIVGDVGVIRVGKAIGNILAFNIEAGLASANIGRIVANAGAGVDHGDGEYHGIVGPVYVIGDIGVVQIGEGIAPSGTGLVGTGGIYAQGQIDRIVGQELGADIRGNVVAARGIGKISLTDGSIINANILVFGNDILASTEVINDFLPAVEADYIVGDYVTYANELFFKNYFVLYDVYMGLGNITLTGAGGIIGSYFHSGIAMGNITVSGGFGMFDSRIEYDAVATGEMGHLRIDGFGIRDVHIMGGDNQGDIIATGKGDLISTLDYSETARYSESYEWDPLFDQRISPLTDLHANLLTAADAPFAVDGLIVDLRAEAHGSLGDVQAYQILSNSPVNFHVTPFTFLDYADDIASITTLDIVDGLEITTGELGSFKPGGDVSRLYMTIAGPISQVVIDGSLLGGSYIAAMGPNGNIGKVIIGGDMDGDIIAYGLIGTVTIDGNLTGNIIVEATNGGKVALKSLKVGGTFSEGSLDINGNVGGIEVLGSLGSPGEYMHIVGDLGSLKVGTDSTTDGSSIWLDIDVVGDLGSLYAYGKIDGNVFIGGSVSKFCVYADAATAAGNIVNGDVTILGSLSSAMVQDGNLNADFTVGDSIGSFTIDGGDLNAGFTLASSFGDVKSVRIEGGDLNGSIVANNGTIGSIDISGSDMGALSRISAQYLSSLTVDGAILGGAAIAIAQRLDKMEVGAGIEAGAVITAGSAASVEVGGNVAGDMALGYYYKGTTLSVGGNLASEVEIDGDGNVSIAGDMLAGAQLWIGGNLDGLTIDGTGSGSIVVDGSGEKFSVGALNGAVIVLGYNLSDLDVAGDVTGSLVQVGASAGEDGQFGTDDLGETARMGSLGGLDVGGEMELSIVAAGGGIDSADVAAGMTDSSISSGFAVGGAEIANVINGVTPLTNIGNLNATRGGAGRTLMSGNFGSATVGGAGLNNSDLTAGVDPGDDGDFGVGAGADADNVITSKTGGNSAFGSVATAVDGTSTVLADGGIGSTAPVGPGVNGNITYAVADITGALPPNRGTAVNGAPLFFAEGGVLVTISIKGNGTVTLYDLDNGDGTIDALVITGADSKTQVEIVSTNPGAVSIGKIVTGDDVALGSLTFDGDLVGDGAAGKDFWLDGPINTLAFRDLDGVNDNWVGQIGGDVGTFAMRTQDNTAKFVIGGGVKSMSVFASEGDALLAALSAAGVDDVTSMAVDSAGNVWVNNTRLANVNLATGATISEMDVRDVLSGGIVALDGIDFLTGAPDALYGVARLYNQSPTQRVGDLATGAIDLSGLAISASGMMVAVDGAGSSDRLMSIDPVTGAASLIGTLRDNVHAGIYNDAVQALAFSTNGTLFGILMRDSDMGGPNPAVPTLVKIETADANNDGYLTVSNPDPVINYQAGVTITGGGTFSAMAVADNGTIYAVRNQNQLVTISIDGTASVVGSVRVNGANADIVGMGFDGAGNLIAYSVAGGGAELVNVEYATNPSNSVYATANNVLSNAIDCFAIARTGGNRATFAYDTAGSGTLYTNPGTIETLGTVDTATGDFLQLRGLTEDADGTPLSANVLSIAVDNAASDDVFVLTDDGRLLRYSETNGALVASWTIGDANTGQALDVTSIDFEGTRLVGVDARFDRPVSIDLSDPFVAAASPLTETGSIDGMDLTALSYDAVTGTFYGYRQSSDEFVALRGTAQADLGGIEANSIDKLTLGGGAAGYGGRIVTTGNTTSSATVEGDFTGALISGGDIKSFKQTGGDFAGALAAAGSIGSAAMSGSVLSSGSIVAALALNKIGIGGSLAGVLSGRTAGTVSVGAAGESTASVEVTDEAKKVTFGGAFDGLAEFGNVAGLTIGGLLDANASVTMLDGGKISLGGGTAAGSSMMADGYVSSLATGQTHSGTIGMRRGLGSAKMADLDGGVMVIGENTGKLAVSGDTVGAIISLGTWVGEDGEYNTDDDVITGGSLGQGAFSGIFRDSVLAVGVLPGASYGEGVPTDLRAYTGNVNSADVTKTDAAEAGGVLKSTIGKLTIKGQITGTSSGTGRIAALATADGVGKLTLSSGGALLVQRHYYDAFGMPVLRVGINSVDGTPDISFPNDSTAELLFSEEVNTASLILSIDADGDGQLDGAADTQGTVGVIDGNGNYLDDVTLTYTTVTEDDGTVRGKLTISKAGLFDGSQLVTLEVSGDLAGPAVYDRSGVRSALRDVNQDGTAAVGEDQAGTILDGDGDGLEGGDLQFIFGYANLGDRTSLLHWVPVYDWYYGCTPTSLAMLVGYYDGFDDYSDLIDGLAYDGDDVGFDTTPLVDEAMASSGDGIYDWVGGSEVIVVPATPGTGHIGDYALYDGVNDYGDAVPYPDLSEAAVRQAAGVTPHQDDSLADFLRTSRSADDLTLGGTYPTDVPNGIEDYFAYRGYSGMVSASHELFGAGLTWETYRAEIDAGRPVRLSVDSNGDGVSDHSVLGIGYNMVTGEYLCYETWTDTPFAATFQSTTAASQAGDVFGIAGGTFIHVAGLS